MQFDVTAEVILTKILEITVMGHLLIFSNNVTVPGVPFPTRVNLYYFAEQTLRLQINA
jgi:hypothetical protein